MIYLASIAINYCFLLIPSKFFPKKLGAVVTLLFLGAVVVLRGRVGTDTSNTYEPMVAYLDQIKGTEPGFLALLHLLKPIFPTSLTTVTMGVGGIFILLLLIYTARCDRDELFILQAFFIPACFFGQAISGQRFGIAFVIIMISMQCARRRQNKWFMSLILMACLMHYSAALFYLLWAAMTLNVKRKSHAISIGVGIVIAIAATAATQSYLAVKYDLYFNNGYDRPSAISGLSTVLIASILMIGIVLGSLVNKEKIRICAITILSLSGFWIVGFYSIAALRLLVFLPLVIPFAALTLYTRHNNRFGRNIKASIALVGVIACAFMFKDFRNERKMGSDISPALPYKFIWEEVD